MSFFSTLKAKLKRVNKKAETGINNHSNKPLEMTCMENQSQNLVVASHNSRFSEDMVDYALEMAQRMDYGIIAVNSANLTHDVTEFFSKSHEVLYQDFKEASAKNVVSFQEKAQAIGLKFSHITKYSNIDHVIDEITGECGDIEFIISENRESTRARGGMENERRIAQRLCVYSIN